MSQPPALPEDPRDAGHLKALEVCHYVMAGLGILGLLFLFGHFLVMRSMFDHMGDFPAKVEVVAERENDLDPGLPGSPDSRLSEEQFEANRQLAEDFFSDSAGFLVGFYVVAGLAIGVMMVLNFLSARFIGQRRNRTFSIVVAALNCLNLPLGTILGVFTIVILSRPTVAASYQKPA